MDQQSLLIIMAAFVVISAIALCIQAGFLFAIFKAIRTMEARTAPLIPKLDALVDTSRPTWRWKEGAEAIGGSTALLAQFQSAERVRQVFFKPGGQTPEVRFNVSPDELDDNVERFRLEIDGQAFEYRHGPPKAVSMSWPGGTVGQAVASFEQRGGAHPQTAFQGPWALFRLLDQASVVPQSDTRLLATFKVNGSQARVLFEAASIRNPIVRQDVIRFRCE